MGSEMCIRDSAYRPRLVFTVASPPMRFTCALKGARCPMKVRGVTIYAMFGQTARAPRFGDSTIGRRDARDAIVMISTRSSSVTTRIKRDASRRRASTRARDDDGGATSARERRDERAGRDGRRGGAYMPAALRSSSIFFAAAARRAWISFSSAAFFARSSSGESVFSSEPS